MFDAINTIIGNITLIVLTGTLCAIGRYFIPKVADYLRNASDSALLDCVINELEYTAMHAVEVTENTIVKQYKADGKWDVDAQKAALKSAADRAIDNLSIRSTNFIEDNGVDIDQIVIEYIEAYINNSKKSVGGA